MAALAAIDMNALQGDYPLANTEACRMLAKALEQANDDKGWSQRQVAKMLGYKTSVALSHMAIGRVPIPVDRSVDFARLLKMDSAEFLLAVLQQRHPDIDFRRVLSSHSSGAAKAKGSDSSLASELESIANMKLDDLPVSVINVMREAVADRNGGRRWMKMGEVSLIERLRSVRPDGLSPAEFKKLSAAIDAL